MLLCFVQHDYNNFNVKANRYRIGLLVGRPSFTRGHIAVPQNVPSLDTVERCFISRWNKMSRRYENGIWAGRVLFDNRLQFGGVSKKHREKSRLFPNYTNSSVKIDDLKSFILNQPFLEVDDADAVRVCLIYILCECFLGKEINDWVPQDCFILLIFDWGSYLRDFTYDDLEDTWNKINKYLSLLERRQTLKYSVSGFTAPIRICIEKNRDMPRMKQWSGTKKLKWVDANKIFLKIQEGQPSRQNMLPSDGEMTSCYYISFQEYVYGERKSVSSPVRDHFRRQDESSSSMSSNGRSHGRGRGSGKHNLEEVLKRLHALEQHVFTNREPEEVFVEEVNNEDLWNNISFEEPAVFQTKFDERVVQDEVMNKNNTTENNFCDIEDDKELEERNDNARNKFDDDVSGEDEVIITRNVDYYDAYGFDGKEVTPNKPRTRKPSQYLCLSYTELHTTLKQKRRAKKKVDIKSTSPVPPTAFAVVHDFSVLRLQPYVASGEVVNHNYLFHSYNVQHHLFNSVFSERLVWAYTRRMIGHITIWYRLLMERRFDGNRHTIMPPNFFVCHALEERQDWRAFMVGIATYPNFMVLLSIHSSLNHWLFGELRLASMEVHIYDSLGRVAYEKLKSDGTFTKFESRVANYLDKINYWARRNIPKILLNM
uniref:Ubiquitin-like protease family profile domain-containing protein n=1 Tax=Lactuca sativa TaxID=4236 RepID=A0A9R1V4K0_LACSA|nr:hypothetical protein LSAT_V11C700352040 [Lactuca sativa]